MLSTLALTAVLAAFPVSPDPLNAARGWSLYSGSDTPLLWRGYKLPGFPKGGWDFSNDQLTLAPGKQGGDLITRRTFTDFEMAFDFKIGPAANSGIIFLANEKNDAPWQSGPEFQLLDDAGTKASPTDPHACGALYDLYPPADAKPLKPAGEWNSARIYLRSGLLQHWINGSKVVEARLSDPQGAPSKEWLDRIAASKFNAYPGFGLQPSGHICIQDHGDTDLSLRNIQIRDLAEPLPGEVLLFNGKDLTGLKAVVPEAAASGKKPEDTWSVRDGILICHGSPAGYIRTEKDYTNFILRLRWRFDPDKGAGNSGVLVRMVGEDKVWPRSVEAQLHSGNAGDFWNIDDFQMQTDPARTNGRNTRKTKAAERPIGEWNEYEIIVHKGDIIVRINGEEVNRAWGVQELPGKVCLQSEGAEIHFRDIRLVELK